MSVGHSIQEKAEASMTGGEFVKETTVRHASDRKAEYMSHAVDIHHMKTPSKVSTCILDLKFRHRNACIALVSFNDYAT